MSGLLPFGKKDSALLDNMEQPHSPEPGSEHGPTSDWQPSYKTRVEPPDPASHAQHGDHDHDHDDRAPVSPQLQPPQPHPAPDSGKSPQLDDNQPASFLPGSAQWPRGDRQSPGDQGHSGSDAAGEETAGPGGGGGAAGEREKSPEAEVGGAPRPDRQPSPPSATPGPSPAHPSSEAAGSPERRPAKSPPPLSTPRDLQPPPPPPHPPASLDDSDSSLPTADTAPLIPPPPSPNKRPSAAAASASPAAAPGRSYGAMEKNGDWGWSPYTSKTDMVPEKTTGAAGAAKKENRGFVYVLACFATLGGLLFGYDTGIVSGSMLLMQPYFDLSTVWQEIIVSGTIGAAALFALIAGFFCDFFGRKKTIMVASFVFTVGAVVMAIADSKEVLLGGRIIVGIGIGFASMTVPVYVAEAAPPDIRGRLVTLNQLFITIGILLSSIIAGAFSTMKDTGWRYMLGIAGAPGLLQFFGFFFLPESPRWLVSKGKDEEAKAVLRKIRGHNDIEEEYQEVKDAEAKKQTGFVLRRILQTPHVRKAMFIGCGLQLFQQLCGINTVIYYSASILKMAGFPPEQAIWLVCVPFGVNFLATFIGVWAVERLGRKILLLFSFVGVTIALIVLAVGFLLSAKYSPPVNATISVTFANGTPVSDQCQGYSICEDCILNDKCGYCYDDNQSGAATCLLAYDDDKALYSDYGRCSQNASHAAGEAMKWSYGYCPTDYTWMAVLGLALFVFSFAPGLGPMPWTINSEIYPMWARGTANSIATTTNWVFNLVVSFTFLTMLETITKYGTFFLFTGICGLGFVFTAIFVPETRNKSLEEVEEVFMTPELREQHKRERVAARDITVEEPADVSGIDTKF